MTPVRAIQILHRVWGSQEVLNASEAKEIEAVELPGETYLHTVCRVAGIDPTSILHHYNGVWLAVRSLLSQREIELAREGKYPCAPTSISRLARFMPRMDHSPKNRSTRSGEFSPRLDVGGRSEATCTYSDTTGRPCTTWVLFRKV